MDRTSGVIAAVWDGSSSARVESTPRRCPSSRAMPMRVYMTLLVTEKTLPVAEAKLFG